MIPLTVWERLVPEEDVCAMRSVEVPTKELPQAELAMVRALEEQGDLVPNNENLPGWGMQPSAPIFVILKTEEECSFIFNCKLGNKAFSGPNPPMKLHNLFTLRDKFLHWTVQYRAKSVDSYLVKLDLTDCYPSLKLPSQVWGSFRVQGYARVSDLCSLPLGWRFSSPICQETVAAILYRLLRQMPLSSGYGLLEEVDFNHYLDDLLLVESDKDVANCWLSTSRLRVLSYLQRVY